MKKKKKKNYYNLIVHAIKLFAILAFVSGIIFLIVPYGKYTGYLIFALFSNTILMYISIILADKYKNKITIDIEKPRAPHTYKIIDEHQMKQSIKDKLNMMNYQVIPDVLLILF